jgi:hypothetical protein
VVGTIALILLWTALVAGGKAVKHNLYSHFSRSHLDPSYHQVLWLTNTCTWTWAIIACAAILGSVVGSERLRFLAVVLELFGQVAGQEIASYKARPAPYGKGVALVLRGRFNEQAAFTCCWPSIKTHIISALEDRGAKVRHIFLFQALPWGAFCKTQRVGAQRGVCRR